MFLQFNVALGGSLHHLQGAHGCRLSKIWPSQILRVWDFTTLQACYGHGFTGNQRHTSMNYWVNILTLYAHHYHAVEMHTLQKLLACCLVMAVHDLAHTQPSPGGPPAPCSCHISPRALWEVCYTCSNLHQVAQVMCQPPACLPSTSNACLGRKSACWGRLKVVVMKSAPMLTVDS